MRSAFNILLGYKSWQIMEYFFFLSFPFVWALVSIDLIIDHNAKASHTIEKRYGEISGMQGLYYP